LITRDLQRFLVFIGLIIQALIFRPQFSQAQISPLADQYQMNFFQVNPATAGVTNLDPLVINSMVSGLRWEKYPTTQSITFQGKLFKEKSYYNNRGFLNRGKNSFGKLGLGIGLFTYSYGAIRQTGVHMDYAYHVFFGKGRLSFGLAPVLIIFSANIPNNSLIFNENPDDVWINDSDPIKLSFLDFNIGVHYYSSNLIAGFSCLQLLNSSIYFKGEYGLPTQESPILNPDLTRSLYAYSGYGFELDRNLRLEPLLLVKFNPNAMVKFRLDISTSLYLFENFQTGIVYRMKEGGGAFFSIKFGQFQIKYQFGFPINSVRPISFTQNTIQLGFNPGLAVL
jgi:type IX secretion system PorP/SprF family membrane protein